MASFALHGGLGLLLLLVTFAPNLPNPPSVIPRSGPFFAPTPYNLRQLLAPRSASPDGGGGSGGERSLIPPTAGQVPSFSNREQIVAPSVHTNLNAVLLVAPTVVGPDQLHVINPNLKNWGIPNATAETGSDGPGCCSGIGTHDGTGDGIGRGPGAGSGADGGCCGEGSAGIGTAIRYPECAYCPKPEYSEEARLAKYQGSVMLSVMVLANGKPGKIEILTSPGMGLGEKAVEAVRNWQFKPAIGRDGKPVATVVAVELVFQLF